MVTARLSSLGVPAFGHNAVSKTQHEKAQGDGSRPHLATNWLPDSGTVSWPAGGTVSSSTISQSWTRGTEVPF